MSRPAPSAPSPDPSHDMWSQALQSLRGAGALLIGRSEGMERFDVSYRGFWRSFGAIVGVLPIFILYLAAEHAVSAAAGTDETVPTGVRWFGFALDWVDMPLAMLGLAVLLGLSHAYVPFVVAYNWGSVIAYALLCAPMTLLGIGAVSPDFAAFATLILLGVVMRYRWFTARVALRVGAVTAFGIALFDLILSLVLIGLTERLVA